MTVMEVVRSSVRWLVRGIGVGGVSYAAFVGTTWWRYGRIGSVSKSENTDPVLDSFIPEYDVVERHYTRVAAPAEITFSAAMDMDLRRSTIIRSIFWAREIALGGTDRKPGKQQPLVKQALEDGWGLLAEIPDREIVVGAVTRAWLADVVFRALPPGEFASFNEPGYVKIVWTLRADPISDSESVFRTETRVATTDRSARRMFRRYWSFVSPGVILIRRLSLGLVKREAERRAYEQRQLRTLVEMPSCKHR
jgi:hypothetical protein